MQYKSEVVDTIIKMLEIRMKREKKHLIKTDTIIQSVALHIDLTDELPEREELLALGIKQVIQSRLFANGYFSITTGFFAKLIECNNLTYLDMMLRNKDATIEKKIAVRNRIKEIKGLAGQMVFVPDDHGALHVQAQKTMEELQADIEADAV